MSKDDLEFVVMPRDIDMEIKEDIGMIMFIVMYMNHKRIKIKKENKTEHNFFIKVNAYEVMDELNLSDEDIQIRISHAFEFISDCYLEEIFYDKINDEISVSWKRDEEFCALKKFKASDRYVYYEDWAKIKLMDISSVVKFDMFTFMLKLENQMHFRNAYNNDLDSMFKYPECFFSLIQNMAKQLKLAWSVEYTTDIMHLLSKAGIITIYETNHVKQCNVKFIVRNQKREREIFIDGGNYYMEWEFSNAHKKYSSYNKWAVGSNKYSKCIV